MMKPSVMGNVASFKEYADRVFGLQRSAVDAAAVGRIFLPADALAILDNLADQWNQAIAQFKGDPKTLQGDLKRLHDASFAAGRAMVRAARADLEGKRDQ